LIIKFHPNFCAIISLKLQFLTILNDISMSLKHFFYILGIICFVQCSKAPVYPIEPQITFKNISKQRMLQSLGNIFRDSLAITISFTDGDGDLGAPEGQAAKPVDVFVIEKENRDTNSFTMPFVAPKGVARGVNGEMTLLLNTTCCKVPNHLPCEKSVDYPLDTVNYELFIVDRAGHKSNVIKLPPIELVCDR
jgi:hypothetical protein